jgi:hypothetical protein
MLRCKLPPSRSTFSQNNATSEIITISRASNWAKITAGLLAAQCTLYILTHNHLSEVWRSIQLIQLWSLFKQNQKGKLQANEYIQCAFSATLKFSFDWVFHFVLYLRLRYAFNMKKAFTSLDQGSSQCLGTVRLSQDRNMLQCHTFWRRRLPLARNLMFW